MPEKREKQAAWDGYGSIMVYLWLLRDTDGSSEMVVRSLARDYANRTGMATASLSERWPGAMLRDTRGKPYFPDVAALSFSLSHSGACGACAFAGKPLGLDIQMHGARNREGIARRFFHPEEYAYLKKEAFRDFFQVWAAKESYVKYTGDGLQGGLRHFAVTDMHGLKDTMDGLRFHHWALHEAGADYSMCLCTAEEGEVSLQDIRKRGNAEGK